MNAYIRRLFARCLTKPNTTRNRPAPRRSALQVDVLEDRITPNTYTVNNTGDTGAGTGLTGDLRYCVTQANANAGLDTITFSLPAGLQTISLATALPNLTQDTTITNPTGAANLIVQRTGAALYSVFTASTAGTFVSFSGLTIRGGSNANGGGINATAAANLTVTGCVITTNTASSNGAGIFVNTNGTLMLQNSTLTGNVCTGDGGAIYFFSGGALTINNCTITGNSAGSGSTSGGGGLYFFGTPLAAPPAGFTPGTVVISNSTVSNNTSARDGGAVVLPSFAGTLRVDNSTFAGNMTTGGEGGGIFFAAAGFLDIRNSSMTGNSASTDGGAIYFFNGGGLLMENSTISGNMTGTQVGGGALYFFGTASAAPPAGFTPSTLVIRNSTINGNTSGAAGGGIVLPTFTGTLQVVNSTLTGNTAGTSGGAIAQTSGGGSISVVNSTIVSNTANGAAAGTGGGGIARLSTTAGTVTVANAVVAGNTNANGPDFLTGASGSTVNVNFSAYTSVTGVTGGLSGTSGNNVVNTLANLMLQTTLTNNGGPTLTFAPMPGSPLVNAGSNALIPGGLTTDQRGGAFLRTFNATVDIGGVESQPPSVTINQAAGQADPTNTGPITFTVVFSTPVTGFTSTDVNLSGSSLTGLAAAVSGSGATYTVTVTGMSGSGTVVATIPAGAVTDPAGLMSLASTSTDNTVTFDNVPPTVTINQGGTQADPTNGTSITFSVLFSEPVTGFTSTDVNLSGSSLTGLAAAVSGSGATYTVTVTGMSGSGTVVATIPVGAATDAVGNSSTASTSTDNTVTFDNVPPTVTINQAAGQADPTNTGPINFTVVFSEPVASFTGSNVSFLGSTVGGSPTAVVTGSGPTYNVAVSGMTGTGNLVVSLLAGVVADPAGNSSAASTSTDNTVSFDNVAPTVTINQAAGQADPTNGSSIVYTITFSESVTGFNEADVALTGTLPGAGSLTKMVTGSGASYTLTLSGMTVGTQGTVVASIPAGGAADAVTNTNTASTSTDNTVTYDTQTPTVTINQAAGQADPTGGTTFLFDVVFSESVTGFDGLDIDFSLSTATGPFMAVVSGSGTTYTVTVTGITSAGDVVATIPAGAASDAIGNTSTASTSTDNSITFVVTPPSVTINQAGGQQDPATGTSIIFSVVFDQLVSGFDGSDVVLTGTLPGVGSLTAMVAPATGPATTYTVTVTGMTVGTQGTVVATIPADAAIGQFANLSAASTSTDNTVTYDTQAPVVTINQAGTQVDPTNTGPVVFSVVFDDPVSGFGPTDVVLTGTLPGVGSLTRMVSGTGTTYTVTVSGLPAGQEGTVIASVAAGGAADLAGNGNTASTSTDNTVLYDNVRPTVTIVQGATQVEPTNGATITFDVTFSELVTGFTDTDVTLSGTLPGAATLTRVVTQTGPTTYTVTVSGMPAGGLGTVVATIAAGLATDTPGNTNTASAGGDNSVLFDNAAPTVTIDQAAGQPDPTNAAIDFTVVFSEPVFGFTDADVILSGSLFGVTGLTKTITGSGPTYTVTVNGLPDGFEGTVIATVAASGVTDEATNPNPASTSTDNTVFYDKIRPAVTIEQAGTQGDPTRFPTVLFTVVFSEPVTGFDAADVVLTGTLPGVAGLTKVVSGSGTNYTLTVSGLPAGGLGTVIASIVDGAAADAVTNPSTVSTSLDNVVLYDNDPSTVTINQAAGQTDPASAGAITFDVVFSEPVFGFTDADVTLGGTLPGVAGLSKVVSGSGTTYTIMVTGMAVGTQGTVVANITSGVATDLAGNQNLAPTTTDNSVTFDSVGPAVTVTPAATQADPTSGAAIQFTVAFSEPVTGFDELDVDLSDSTIGGSLSAVVSGSGTTYTITVTGMAPGLGAVVATILPGAALDASGNGSAAPTNMNNTVTFDTVAPTVTINRLGGTGPTNGSPMFTVVFSEPVTSFTGSDVSLAGSTVGGALSASVSGSGTTYTVTVTGMTGVGNVVASIPSVGAALDLAGNASDPSTSTNNVVPFDGVAPTATINRAAGQLDPSAGSPINFTVVFSEPVTGFTAADVNLSASTAGGPLVASVSGSGTTYTVSVTGMSSPGDVIATIPAGAGVDLAGNTSGAATSIDNAVGFNNVAATVTINQAAGQADPVTAGAIVFTVVFSKPVVGFGPASLDFTGSTVGGVLVADVTGSDTTYTVSVTGMDGAGVLVVSIPAGVVNDALGNPNAASSSSDNSVRFDNVAPTATVEQSSTQADPTAGNVVFFTVVFSEPVFGFSSSDVSLAGSTAGGALFASVTGSGTTYNVSVTGMSTPGTVVATIPAGALTDAAGNANIASTSIDNVVAFDNTAPTVTVTQAATQSDPATTGPVLFTVTFSAPVTGFDASDVSLAGSTAGGRLTASVSGTGTTYTVAVDGMTSTGDVVVSIPAGVAQDGLGNGNLASTSTDNRVTFTVNPGGDTTPPSATLVKAATQSDPTAALAVSFTITFSEAVTGFDASDVSLADSTATGSLAAAVSGSGTTYTITVTGMTGPGSVAVSVPAGAAADAAGNPSLSAGGAAVTFTGTGQPAEGVDTFATGAGAGGSPRVDVYNTGRVIFSTTAFGPAFTGGNRVAVGDVTGDGVADYVMGTGPGVSTLVQAISGADNQPILSYQPFEATFLGGVFVSVGDVTGDGTADILISPDQGGGPRVLVLRGGDFGLAANFFGINDPNFRGGARAAAGDINADGFADVAVAAGFQGGPRVSVYDGRALAQGQQVNLFGDLFIFDGPDATTLRNGAFIAVGDVDGDGFADLIGGGGPGGSPRVIALSGADLLNGPATQASVLANFFAGPDSNRGGVPLAVKDLDGDRFADLVTGSGPGAGTRVTTFQGSTLSSGDPTELSSFDAFGGFNNGVFVG